jgi:hypothetical protein
LQSALTSSHGVVLNGLAGSTTYYYVVRSADSNGNVGSSSTYTFTTANDDTNPPGVTTPATPTTTTPTPTASAPVTTTAATTAATGNGPYVGYVAAWGVTGSGATISWSTNVLATTWLSYGTTPNLGQTTPAQTDLTLSHGVTLTGLAGGTTYYFVAQSADANGNVGASATFSFTTVVTAPPVISNISVVPGTDNHATITWTTTPTTASWVQFGLTTAYGKYSTKTGFTNNPSPNMGWVPSGLVHYQLVSVDALGNQVVSPDYTFTEP